MSPQGGKWFKIFWSKSLLSICETILLTSNDIDNAQWCVEVSLCLKTFVNSAHLFCNQHFHWRISPQIKLFSKLSIKILLFWFGIYIWKGKKWLTFQLIDRYTFLRQEEPTLPGIFKKGDFFKKGRLGVWKKGKYKMKTLIWLLLFSYIMVIMSCTRKTP